MSYFANCKNCGAPIDRFVAHLPSTEMYMCHECGEKHSAYEIDCSVKLNIRQMKKQRVLCAIDSGASREYFFCQGQEYIDLYDEIMNVVN